MDQKILLVDDDIWSRIVHLDSRPGSWIDHDAGSGLPLLGPRYHRHRHAGGADDRWNIGLVFLLFNFPVECITVTAGYCHYSHWLPVPGPELNLIISSSWSQSQCIRHNRMSAQSEAHHTLHCCCQYWLTCSKHATLPFKIGWYLHQSLYILVEWLKLIFTWQYYDNNCELVFNLKARWQLGTREMLACWHPTHDWHWKLAAVVAQAWTGGAQCINCRVWDTSVMGTLGSVFGMYHVPVCSVFSQATVPISSSTSWSPVFCPQSTNVQTPDAQPIDRYS